MYFNKENGKSEQNLRLNQHLNVAQLGTPSNPLSYKRETSTHTTFLCVALKPVRNDKNNI